MNKCLVCDKSEKHIYRCPYKGSDGMAVLCSGPWVEDKHYFLERYCDIFAQGMKNKWPVRYYIDLFSGPGLCINREVGNEVEGSPLIALHKLFTNYIFVEADEENMEALRQRTQKYQNQKEIDFILGDANKCIDKLLEKIRGNDALFFVFGDPYNIQLKMATIKQLTRNRRLDLLIHFPYGTYFQRVLPQRNLKPQTIMEINEFFGSEQWKNIDKINVKKFIDFYGHQIKKFGYSVSNNFPNMRNRKNAGLYYLVFASKNRRGLDFWRKTCTIDSRGQRKFNGF